MHGEEESLSGFPSTTAGELQKIVESRGQKTFQQNCQTSPTSPRVVFQSSDLDPVEDE